MKSIVSYLLVCSVIIPSMSLAWEPAEFTPNVVDETGVLSRNELSQINSEIQNLREKNQIWTAVYILPNLKDESIESAAEKTFRNWRLGEAGKDNGLLFLFALRDREARIEVGYGLEGAIPDITAKRVLDYKILPHFKNGRYADGIVEGIRTIGHLQLNSEKLTFKTAIFSNDEFNRSWQRGLALCLSWAVIVFLIPFLLKLTFFALGYLSRLLRPALHSHPARFYNPFWSLPFRSKLFYIADLTKKFTWIVKAVVVLLGTNFLLFEELRSSLAFLVGVSLYGVLATFAYWTHSLMPLVSDRRYARSLALQRLERIRHRIPKSRLIFGKQYSYSSSSSSGSSSSSSSGGGRSGGGGASSRW